MRPGEERRNRTLGDRTLAAFRDGIPFGVGQLNKATRERLLSTFRQAIASGPPLALSPSCPSTIADLLIHAARQAPDQGIVFVQESGDEEFLSYPDLLEQSIRAAMTLRRRGVASGQPVIVVMRNTRDYVVAFWGIVLAGAIPVPLPSGLAAGATAAQASAELERLARIWRRLGAGPYVAGPDIAALAGKVDASLGGPMPAPLLPASLVGEETGSSFEPLRDQPALLLYSSGSVGDPKGVIVSHENLIANIAATAQHNSFGPDDPALCWAPLYHVIGLMCFHLLPLFTRARQVIIEPVTLLKRPEIWFDKIHAHRVAFTGGPNFAFPLACERIPADRAASWNLSSLKVLLNGGEVCSVANLRAFASHFAVSGLREECLAPAYGMSEATAGIAYPKPHERFRAFRIDRRRLQEENQLRLVEAEEDEGAEIANLGYPLPGFSLRVVDDDDRPLAEGGVGHVQIKGPAVTSGYYEDSLATREAFIDGWLRTGDMGFLWEGQLGLLGRSKDVLISRGHKFHASDVEQIALRTPGVPPGGALAVSVAPSGAGEEKAVLLLQVTDGDARDAARQASAAILQATGLRIDHVLSLTPERLPKTPTGKLSRKRLRDALATLDLEKEDLLASPPGSAARPLSRQALPDLERLLLERVAAALSVSPADIELNRGFVELGGDSLMGVKLVRDLEDALGAEFPATLFFESRNLRELADALRRQLGAPLEAALASAEPQHATDDQARVNDIAIVGMAGRFPGAANLDEFWKNLHDGVDSVGEIPPERWRIEDYFDPDPKAPGKATTKWGGFLSNVADFDAAFFGVTPHEAARMDPQQRLLLETCWEALEYAGLAGKSLSGASAGVFVGISVNDYLRRLYDDPLTIDAYGASGNFLSIAANRLSYAFNLRGPSLAVDTACSSSLVALNLAVASLRKGECSLAIVGSSHLIFAPELTVNLSKAGMMAKDGRCKTFDARADGYVRSEGVGMLVLKTLSQAIADGDTVHAVIKGIAVNHGGRASGLTVPNADAQAEVIAAAYRDARVEPSSVSYIEAHGTGTELGDPIEVRALARVFGGPGRAQRCGLGTVKTNIGHLEPAAGMAGLLKVILALKHRELPASIHLMEPNWHLALEASPFHAIDRTRPWTSNGPRRAGVSAFGIGGANAHVVLEEAPSLDRAQPIGGENLLVLSARDEAALKSLAGRYRDALNEKSGLTVADVCWTAATGRTPFTWRLAIRGADPDSIKNGLDDYLDGLIDDERVSAGAADQRLVVSILAGTSNGETLTAARRWYLRSGPFRAAIDAAAPAFEAKFGRSLAVALDDDATSMSAALTRSLSALIAWALGQTLFTSAGVAFRLFVESEGGRQVAFDPHIQPGALLDALDSLVDLPARDASLGALVVRVGVVDRSSLPSTATIERFPSQPLALWARLFVLGADPDWRSILPARGRHIPLPTYPFQRRRYWIDPPARRTTLPPGRGLDTGEPIDRLLGRSLSTPLTEKIFERTIGADELSEHAADHSSLVVAILSAAARSTGGAVLVDVKLNREASALRPGAIMSIVRPSETPQVEIFSRSEGASEWTLLASGRAASRAPSRGDTSFDAFRSRCSRSVDLGDARLQRLTRGEAEALAQLADPLTDDPVIAMLRGAKLASRALFPSAPVDWKSIAHVALSGAARPIHFVQLTWTARGGAGPTFDVVARDENGHEVARAIGGQAETTLVASRRAGPPRPEELLYQVRWRDRPAPEPSPSAGWWLIAAPRGTPSGAIAKELEQRGARVGRWDSAFAPGADEERVRSQLRSLIEEFGPECAGVVIAMAPASPEASASGPAVLCLVENRLAAALTLIKAVINENWPARPRVWFLAQGVLNPDSTIVSASSVVDQCLVGFARTIRWEFPDLSATWLDVDPDDSDAIASAANELMIGDAEPVIAVRQGRRYVARLLPIDAKDGKSALAPSARAMPSARSANATTSRPGPDEVLIHVLFSDVSIDAARPRTTEGPVTTFVGAVTAAGSGTTFAIGQQVVAIGVVAGRETMVSVKAEDAAPLPEGVEPKDAAALWPFLVARAALELGGARPARRILVTEATTAVGLAAYELARGVGAVVRCAARRPLHREFLESLPADVVDLDDPAVVARLTGPRGVDVIIGPAPLEAAGERLWLDTSDAPTGEASVATAMRDPERRRALFHSTLAELASGQLRATPRRVITSIDRVADDPAVGGALLAHDATLAPPPPLTRGEGVYLITGGLGAIGQRIARWLARRGARRLVIVDLAQGDHEPLRDLEEAGVDVRTRAVDVTDPSAIEKVLDEIRATGRQLRGVIHAAGVIEDAAIPTLTAESLHHVLAPKVAGAWNLSRATENDRLDFFVMFSSFASVAGFAGQAGYAAANAFLDGLARYRNSRNLPALAVQWGPWSGTAATAPRPGSGPIDWQVRGIFPLEADVALEALSELHRRRSTEASVVDIDWPVYESIAGPEGQSPMLAELRLLAESAASRPSASPEAGLREQLRGLEPDEAAARLIEFVRAAASKVMGFSESEPLDVDTPLTDAGMDSVMAIELTRLLQPAVGRALPATLLNQFPTTRSLAGRLAQLATEDGGKGAALSGAPTAGRA